MNIDDPGRGPMPDTDAYAYSDTYEIQVFQNDDGTAMATIRDLDDAKPFWWTVAGTANAAMAILVTQCEFDYPPLIEEQS